MREYLDYKIVFGKVNKKLKRRCYEPYLNLKVLNRNPFQTYDHNSNVLCFPKFQGGWWFRLASTQCTDV